MTDTAALDWLYSASMSGIKLGLENIRDLLRLLGNPQEGLTFAHVAGTNGKGSVCAMMDAILRAEGRKCGLYTSPHLVEFGERIRVNGDMIPDAEITGGLSRIRDLVADWDHPPTFFEVATALALWHFARQRCEVVVLETGLGGRLDATNVVHPAVSVITPIALDHCQWLGDSLREIATEKAGIIKPGVPVVSAAQPPEAADVLNDRARALGTSIRFVEKPWTACEVALRGRHQRKNAALAVAALDAANLTVSEAAVEAGLRSVAWPGRFQFVGERFVLDGGHNPHAAAQLAANWREAFGSRKATVVFGALTDKDAEAMLRLLTPVADEFFFVPVRSHRSADPAHLAAVAGGKVFPTLQAALSEAGDGPVLITGSLFLVGEAMEILGIDR